MIDLKNKVFLDTDGEMTFENKERVNFIMYFTRIGANYSTLETANSVFVHEDTETSFKEIWLPCAESKQAEIDSLKAEKHGAEIGHEHFVKQLKERHSQEIEQLKSENAALKEKLGNMEDCWYWDGAEYYVTDPYQYDLNDLDNFEIITLEKYQTTPRVPEYFCKVFEDEDTCEIIAFPDYADAKKAIANNKRIFNEAQGDGDE